MASISLLLTPAATAIYFSAYFPVWLSILFGNGLVIFAFRQNQNLRTPINYPLASLAVNDFLIGTVALPLSLVPRLVRSPLICRESPRFLFFLPSTILFFSSTLHLFGISFMRFVSLSRPLRYPQLLSLQRVKVSLIICWLISVAEFCLVLSVGVSAEENMICDGGVYQNPFILGHYLMTAFLMPIILVGMFSLYLYMLRIAFFLVVQRRRQGNVRISQLVKARQLEARSKFRGLVTMAIVVGAFCFCWMPTSVRYIYILIKRGKISQDTYNLLHLFTEYPAFLNAMLNPIIYAFRNKEFRLAYRKTWKKMIQCCKSVVTKEDGHITETAGSAVQMLEVNGKPG